MDGNQTLGDIYGPDPENWPEAIKENMEGMFAHTEKMYADEQEDGPLVWEESWHVTKTSGGLIEEVQAQIFVRPRMELWMLKRDIDKESGAPILEVQRCMTCTFLGDYKGIGVWDFDPIETYPLQSIVDGLAELGLPKREARTMVRLFKGETVKGLHRYREGIR